MAAVRRLFSYSSATWVAVLMLLAYLLYLYHQHSDLHALYQHELALQVRELESLAKNAVTTVRNADSDDLCRFDADQPYLDLVDTQSCKDFTGKGLTKDARLHIEADIFIRSESAKPEFRLRLDRVLAELAFPDSFQLVFLATDQGAIIYQESPASRRLRRQLSWHEENLREPVPGEADGLAIANVKDILGKDHQPDFTQLSAAGSHFRIDVGGVSQEIYVQPVKLNGHKAVMGGVVQSAELFRRALEVDTYLVAVLVFLFLMGLLGTPFVKLIALDRRERFTLGDVRSLYLSSGALLLLGVFSVLALDGYFRFAHDADEGLKDLAGNLSKNLAAEMGEAVKQLHDFDERAAKLETPPGCTEAKPVLNWFGPDQTPLPAPTTLPVHAEQVAWIRPDGRQVLKITGDSRGKNVDVSERVYFRAIRDGSSYRLQGEEFFAGPALSITDGKFYTFFSIRSNIQPKDCSGAPLTAVLTTRLLSMSRQPLPASYGFAVISREGAVLYHSDRRIALRQNLFAELGNPARLKSLVLGRRQAHMTGSYRERPHRFYVAPFQPLQQANLFIVTFRDVSPEIATVAQAFVVSIALIPVLGLIWWVSLFVLDWVSHGAPGVDRNGTWMWPQQSMARFYRWFAIALLAMLAAAVVVLLIDRDWGQLAFIFFPLATIPLGIAGHLLTKETGNERGRLGSPWWRRTMWALVVVWLAFAPPIVLFRMLLTHEYGKLVDTERAWIDQQRKDAHKSVMRETRDEEYPDSVGNRVSALQSGGYRVKPPEPFGEPARKIQSGMERALVAWLDSAADWLPIQSETAMRLRSQDSLGSLYYSLGSPNWWAWVLLIVLFLAANLWIRWNAHHMLLVDLENPDESRLPDDREHWGQAWEVLSPDERNLILQISSEHLANPKQRETVEKLIKEGYLKLDPDLRPRTKAFREFLAARATDQAQTTELQAWEQVSGGHSWNYVQKILYAGLAVIFIFIVVTQPRFQTGLTAWFGGATTALVAVAKLRDAAASLWPRKPGSADG